MRSLVVGAARVNSRLIDSLTHTYTHRHVRDNARHLWRRTPPHLKGEGGASTLAQAWAVGKRLWTRCVRACICVLVEDATRGDVQLLPGKKKKARPFPACMKCSWPTGEQGAIAWHGDTKQ